MFTGIIEAVGRIAAVRDRDGGRGLTIAARGVTPRLRAGDSLAVNGCCLTVERIARGAVEVTAVEETLAKTNLDRLTVGSPVNLERPLAVGARLGGHFVLGHVDCTTRVTAVRELGTERLVTFALPARFARLVIPVGSVAIDGVSLTVARLTARAFTVAIIPYTWAHTLFGTYRAGSVVNVEFDMVGKYVLRDRAVDADAAG